VLRQFEYDPTDDAPVSGRYELLNVFGTATGEAVSAMEGERLPAAPRGFSWRQVAVDEPLEVARRRLLEAERRIERQVALIRQVERNGEAVIADIARALLRALEGAHRAAYKYVERLKAFPR
jgi:hypothetical protein